MNPIRLLIVDDHDFFRRSILLPLDVEPDIEIVGTATSGDQAVTLARSLRPDVILMDLNMPYLSGLGAMERIVPQERAPAILVLTGKDDAQSVADAFAAGAQGFLRKDMITDDLLISAIFTVASGGVFVDGRTFRLIKNSFLAGQPKMAGERQGHIHLSPDESQLLRYITLGLDNDQIGQQLQNSPKTISNRLTQLYLHLGVGNRVQAVTYALRNGLVDLSETL